jgi:hypothetical protein
MFKKTRCKRTRQEGCIAQEQNERAGSCCAPQQRDYYEESKFSEGKEIINGWTGN